MKIIISDVEMQQRGGGIKGTVEDSVKGRKRQLSGRGTMNSSSR